MVEEFNLRIEEFFPSLFLMSNMTKQSESSLSMQRAIVQPALFLGPTEELQACSGEVHLYFLSILPSISHVC